VVDRHTLFPSPGPDAAGESASSREQSAQIVEGGGRADCLENRLEHLEVGLLAYRRQELESLRAKLHFQPQLDSSEPSLSAFLLPSFLASFLPPFLSSFLPSQLAPLLDADAFHAGNERHALFLLKAGQLFPHLPLQGWRQVQQPVDAAEPLPRVLRIQ